MTPLIDRRAVLVEHARKLVQFGAAIVRIPPVDGKPTKGPRGTGWQHKSASPDEFTEHDNLGILDGDPSNLIDVDLDCPEAVALAPRFLPATELVHGRPSAPASHRWYRCAGATKQFGDPTRTGPDAGKAMLVELRGTGGQTMVAPSIHPDTGEVVRWEVAGQPAAVAYDDLLRAVRHLAAASLLARHWPGSRHYASMALSGALARAGWNEDAIAAFVTAIASWVNKDDGEPGKRYAHARDSIAKLASGGMVTGIPKLIELGVPEKVITKVREWLELKDPAENIIEGLFGKLGSMSLAPTSAPATTQSPPSAPVATSIRASSLVGEIRAKSNVPVVLTPFPKFNEKTGGLELGSVTIIVGFQGGGKTSLAAQLGAHHASIPGHATVYYLAEMPPRVLAARIIGQRTDRAWQDVLRGTLTDAEMAAVLDPLELHIIGRAPNPIEAIKATIAQLRAGGVTGTIMLVIDYLQLLADFKLDLRAGNAKVARDIMQLTEDHNLVTIALSQTSRDNSKRIRAGAQDSIDLADTGAESSELERSATVQLALSYQQKDDTLMHEVIGAIGKRRFGGPTKCYFLYEGRTGLWIESGRDIVPKAEQDREREIIIQLENHAVNRCKGDIADPKKGGFATCGARLLASEFSRPKGPHKVTGSKGDVTKTLERMVRERTILKLDSGEYALRDDHVDAEAEDQ